MPVEGLLEANLESSPHVLESWKFEVVEVEVVEVVEVENGEVEVENGEVEVHD